MRCGEVYLYGDKTVKVNRDSVEVLPRGVPTPGIGSVGSGFHSPNFGNGSHHLRVVPPLMSCANFEGYQIVGSAIHLAVLAEGECGNVNPIFNLHPC